MNIFFSKFNPEDQRVKIAYFRLLENIILVGFCILFSSIQLGIWARGWSIVCFVLAMSSLGVSVASYLLVYFMNKFKHPKKIFLLSKYLDIVNSILVGLGYWFFRFCNYSKGSAFFETLCRSASFLGCLVSTYFVIMSIFYLKREIYRTKLEDNLKENFYKDFEESSSNYQESVSQNTSKIDEENIIEVEVIDKK